MQAIVEYVLDGWLDTNPVQTCTVNVQETQEGYVDANVALDGAYTSSEAVEGSLPSPFELLDLAFPVPVNMYTAFSADEVFYAYTDARTGAVSYLLYEQGGRVTLEQSGYVVL